MIRIARLAVITIVWLWFLAIAVTAIWSELYWHALAAGVAMEVWRRLVAGAMHHWG